jgi:imidazole glycerol-phosphate synthase subunit HisF
MLRARVIPSLLVRRSGLVKTRKFGDEKYVGDPINAVRIFNEKEVDELVVCDIDATAEGREPDYQMIAHLAAECRMPLCYGGGVTSVEQAKRIMEVGVEKVAISAAAVQRPELVAEIAQQVGRQSVVVVLDVKKKFLGGYRVHVRNGTVDTKINPVDFARQVQELGAGEIVVNSIDQDGMMQGYDLILAKQVRDAVDLPMTILGGAGSYAHMEEAVSQLGTIGLAAGSLFVFKGQYRAVLINYPKPGERAAIQQAVGR